MTDTNELVTSIATRARAAGRVLAQSGNAARQEMVKAMAAGLRTATDDILTANARDLEGGTDLTDAQRDRLRLTPARIAAAADGLEAVADLPDPLGRSLADWTRPNGLRIVRVSVPIGVIGVIYEARPLVTADAAALAIRAGNAVILRPGSDSFQSSCAVGAAIAGALEKHRFGEFVDAAIVVPTTDRAAVGAILAGAGGNIDLVVPRGGRSLVERVQRDARVPVLGHLDGICHVYVDRDADPAMAVAVTVNAKMRRTGICGAAEKVLVDAAIAAKMVPVLTRALSDAGCEVRGDKRAQALDASLRPSTAVDWDTEYLASIITMGVVDGIDGALAHLARHSSGHTDSIVTANGATAARFLAAVDSAIVMHNASTQFADGGEFGMGAEIGIATGRLPPRGPVGAQELTSYKYVVHGSGQTRPA